MSRLWNALCVAYRVLGFESVTKGDDAFRDLVLARMIEPISKADASQRAGTEPLGQPEVQFGLPGRQPRSRSGLQRANSTSS
jgi:hypothetical protein